MYRTIYQGLIRVPAGDKFLDLVNQFPETKAVYHVIENVLNTLEQHRSTPRGGGFVQSVAGETIDLMRGIKPNNPRPATLNEQRPQPNKLNPDRDPVLMPGRKPRYMCDVIKEAEQRAQAVNPGPQLVPGQKRAYAHSDASRNGEQYEQLPSKRARETEQPGYQNTHGVPSAQSVLPTASRSNNACDPNRRTEMAPTTRENNRRRDFKAGPPPVTRPPNNNTRTSNEPPLTTQLHNTREKPRRDNSPKSSTAGGAGHLGNDSTISTHQSDNRSREMVADGSPVTQSSFGAIAQPGFDDTALPSSSRIAQPGFGSFPARPALHWPPAS